MTTLAASVVRWTRRYPFDALLVAVVVSLAVRAVVA